MRKLLYLLTALLMLAVLPLGALAEENIQSMIEGLPTVEEFRNMDSQEQMAVYNRTQELYDVYMTMTEEEKEAIPGAEETFGALFSYFNTMVMPVTEPVVEEPTFRIPWIAITAAVATALVIGWFRKRA